VTEEIKESSEAAEGHSTATAGPQGVKLQGLFAHKVGMSSIYDADGKSIPVTVLKLDQWVVSQIKTLDTDGYEAIQIASGKKKPNQANAAEKANFKKAGFENGPKVVREVRQAVPAGAQVGQKIAIESLAKGDVVSLVSKSKGKGFAGSIKRFNFAGGPASHGSKFHRQPGSSGNRTWPGRVMPGKKFPGHLGDETVTVKNVKVVEVLAEEGLIVVKGPVPGARNTLVKITKIG
jgi:large subunit ribosomal protein L3